MKPSKHMATVGMVVAVSSRHCDGTHVGRVTALHRDPGEKYPQRVSVEVTVNPEQCAGSRGLYDSLKQRGDGGFVLRDIPFVDPLSSDERAEALAAEPFVAEVREVPKSAPALRAPAAPSKAKAE